MTEGSMNRTIRITLVNPPNVGDASVEFRAHLTGSVSDSLTYNWSSFMDPSSEITTKFLHAVKSGIGKLSGNLASKLPAALAKHPELTKMIGGFPDYMTVNITCRLWTKSDPVADVWEPMKTLKRMVTPKLANAMVIEPKYLSVWVGTGIYLPEAVLTHVDTTYSEAIIRGLPAFADLTLSFSTSEIVYEDMIDTIYVSSRVE